MNPIVTILHHQFQLLPQAALFWVNKNALLISDVHLGKATHFRKNGLALPAMAGKKDVGKMVQLFQSYPQAEIFILGDLFHASLNIEWQWFIEILNQFPERTFFLIRGNHDILPAYAIKMPNLKVVYKFVFDGICLLHEPKGDENEYVISGHIHPGITLWGKAKQRLRLPCFVVGSNRMILPSFGTLTGLANFSPLANDKIWVIAHEEVLPFM